MMSKPPTKVDQIAKLLTIALLQPTLMFFLLRVFHWKFWVSGLVAVAVAVALGTYVGWLVRKRQVADGE